MMQTIRCKKIIVFSFLFLLAPFIYAQSVSRTKIINRNNDDESIIRMMMNEITQGMRLGDVNRIMAHFDSKSENKITRSTLSNIFAATPEIQEKAAFSFSNLTISIERQDAQVAGFISSGSKKAGENVGFHLHKSNQGVWKITSSENFFNQVNSFIKKYGTLVHNNTHEFKSFAKLKNKSSEHTVQDVSRIPSTHMLIPWPLGHNGSTPVWQVSAADANSQLGKSLLYFPRDFDDAPLSVDNNGYITSEAAFVLDVLTNRIIYAGDNSGNWIKSYGDNSGDHQFNQLNAIQVYKMKTTPEQWIVYVADRGNHEIDKLKFDPTTQTISYIFSIRSGLGMPSDVVALPQALFGDTDGEDWLYVADAQLGALLYVNNNGANTHILAKITSYTYGGVTYPITKPLKVLWMPDLNVVFIDGTRNAVVTLAWNDIPQAPTTNNTAIATNFVKFDSPSSLNSIGFGVNNSQLNDFYVTDVGLNLVHKFSYTGEYLSSFSSFTSDAAVAPSEFNGRTSVALFNNPVMFGSSNWNNPDIPPLSSYELNTWPTTGFQKFVPGADIVSGSIQTTGTDATLQCKFTNECIYTSQIFNSNNTVVKDFTQGCSSCWAPAGTHADFVLFSELGYGTYTWKVTALPYFNSQYVSQSGHNFKQNAIVKTYTFTIPCNSCVTITSSEADGWNMSSVPDNVLKFSKGQVWPTATSDAFAYNGSFYSATPLSNGLGYFVKFSGDQNVTYTGTSISQQNISVPQGSNGWSLIGSISTPVATSRVNTNTTPPNIISSFFFSYIHGYYIINWILPGQAYWVKVNSSGTLTLDANHLLANALYFYPYEYPPAHSSIAAPVLIGPYNGAPYTPTYQTFSWNAVNGTNIKYHLQISASPYYFDPVFDEWGITDTYKDVPLACGTAYQWHVNAEDANGAGNWSMNYNLSTVPCPGGGGGGCYSASSTSATTVDPHIDVQEDTKKKTASNIKEFRIDAFPNPFNPVVQISYDLPISGSVRLAIYDVLGQRLESLSNAEQQSGTYQLQWDGSKYSSGLYFIKFEVSSATGKMLYSKVEKMTLLK